MNVNHYTYRVTWSAEDKEHVGLCTEFPSLSWLAPSPEKALSGIRQVVAPTHDDFNDAMVGTLDYDSWNFGRETRNAA
jgi:hypothetical protein